MENSHIENVAKYKSHAKKVTEYNSENFVTITTKVRIPVQINQEYYDLDISNNVMIIELN